MIFYLRIFWFPFIVLNYAAGATRIRFRDYLLGTALGLLPPVFIFTYFVGAMRDALATYRRPADLLTFDLIFPVLLLVFSFFLPTVLKRMRKGRELLPCRASSFPPDLRHHPRAGRGGVDCPRDPVVPGGGAVRGDRRRRGKPGPHGGDRARPSRRGDLRAAGEGDADERGRGDRPGGCPPLPARGHLPARGIRNRGAWRAARSGGDRRRLSRPPGRVPRAGRYVHAALGITGRMIGARAGMTRAFTGDQAIFVRAETFRRVGGYPEIPLMEDVELSRRMRRAGKTVLLPLRVETSGRRWEAWGPLRTVLFMWRLRIGHLLGRMPSRTAEAYRRGPLLMRREPSPPTSSAGE